MSTIPEAQYTHVLNSVREQFDAAVAAKLAADGQMAELTKSAHNVLESLGLQPHTKTRILDNLTRSVQQETAKRMKISPHHNEHSPNGENSSHIDRTGYRKEDCRSEFLVG